MGVFERENVGQRVAVDQPFAPPVQLVDVGGANPFFNADGQGLVASENQAQQYFGAAFGLSLGPSFCFSFGFSLGPSFCFSLGLSLGAAFEKELAGEGVGF